jgi:hypothetical protein
MKRSLAALPLALLLSGCALPGTVHRIGVEYNTAVAGMANELTLLNIVRAKEDLPLHYTSVSRLSGSVTIKGTTSLNGQLKADGTTDTATHQAAVTATTAVTDTLARATAKGANIYTPSFGGEVNTGPTFDIAILDTQKFYQGILAAVPFPTIQNYIDQGYDNQLVIRLLVERIDIKLKEDGPHGKAGTIVKTYWNDPSGPRAKEFADALACYVLSGTSVKKAPVALAPLSRLTRNSTGKPTTLKMDDLAKLDGKALDVKPTLPAGSPPPAADAPRIPLDSAGDDQVMVQRLSEEKHVAELSPATACNAAFAIADRDLNHPVVLVAGLPRTPPAEPVYAGEGKVLLLAASKDRGELVDAELQVTFRSTEGVIRFVGQYLQAAQDEPGKTWRLGTQPLFSVVEGDPSDAIVSTELLHRRYAIADDANRRRNMMVVALIEQLVNLHKESTDRPVTVPVQVVP